jgi:hypothetical protein
MSGLDLRSDTRAKVTFRPTLHCNAGHVQTYLYLRLDTRAKVTFGGVWDWDAEEAGHGLDMAGFA